MPPGRLPARQHRQSQKKAKANIHGACHTVAAKKPRAVSSAHFNRRPKATPNAFAVYCTRAQSGRITSEGLMPHPERTRPCTGITPAEQQATQGDAASDANCNPHMASAGHAPGTSAVPPSNHKRALLRTECLQGSHCCLQKLTGNGTNLPPHECAPTKPCHARQLQSTFWRQNLHTEQGRIT